MKWAYAAVIAACGPLAAPAGATEVEAAYQRALLEYECGHYARSIEHFRLAAELGDARSPGVLALMYRMGERLYGDQVRADEAEADRWTAVAVDRYRAGRLTGPAQRQ